MAFGKLSRAGATNNHGGVVLSAIVSGGVFALGAAVCGAILVGIVVTIAGWKTDHSGVFAAFNYLCILVGGVAAGRKAGRMGWLHGVAVGLIYYGGLTLIMKESILTGAAGFSTLTWSLRAFFACLVGAVGGMIGVGL